jgi:hypothetical protein
MMVVHVASDAFVGTVAQAVTFWYMLITGQQQFGFSSYCININLKLFVTIYSVAMGQ